MHPGRREREGKRGPRRRCTHSVFPPLIFFQGKISAIWRTHNTQRREKKGCKLWAAAQKGKEEAKREIPTPISGPTRSFSPNEREREKKRKTFPYIASPLDIVEKMPKPPPPPKKRERTELSVWTVENWPTSPLLSRTLFICRSRRRRRKRRRSEIY